VNVVVKEGENSIWKSLWRITEQEIC